MSVKTGGLTATEQHKARTAPYKVLLEEGTGMSCGWCVRGIAAIEQAYSRFPDEFVAVAIHSGDALECDDYKVNDVMSASGLPASILNRKTDMDPSPANVQNSVEAALAVQMRGAVEASTRYSATEGTVTVDATVVMNSFYSDGDYRIVCLAKEVEVRNAAFYQNNSYSGGTNGVMGGFEDKPGLITGNNMIFPDVARGTLTPLRGTAGLLPSSMKAGETAYWNETFSLPSSVDNPENVRIVVALVDGRTGEVLNVDELPLDSSASIPSTGYERTEASTRIFDLTGREVKNLKRDTVYVRAGHKFIVTR